MSLLNRINKTPSQPNGGGNNAPTPPGKGTGSIKSDSPSTFAIQTAERAQAIANAPPVKDNFTDLKGRVQGKLLNELQMDNESNDPQVRARIEELFNQILSEEGTVLPKSERSRLLELIMADILGFGPMEALLAEESVTEIMVNGPKNVFVEQKGRLTRSPIVFDNDDHVLRILDRIVAPLGRRVDESSPMVDARLPDGSRVNAVIRPVAIDGPTITIRKFAKTPLTVEDLVRFGSMTQDIAKFLQACVISRLNVVVSGGTGSGKTTLLNVLSSFIPSDERIVTIENAAELQLRQEHIVRLESRPPNIEGKGELTIRDLVTNSLRMRPDRIIVGECRSSEALDMLQAMNTGHDGSMTTLHSNSPRDTLARLEVMCLMAGMDLPVRAIREQVASAIQLIVHQERLRDGTRKIVKISEIQGMEGEIITMSDIFEFEQTGVESGKVIGRLRATGLRPKFIETLEMAGQHLPPTVFGIGNGRF